MTPVRISVAAAIASLLLILIVLELIRGRRLKERYALLWLVTGVVLLVLSVWRGGLNTIAGWLGVATLPTGDPLRGRHPVHHRRPAALLDGPVEALRPEHGAGAAARAARGAARRAGPRRRGSPSTGLTAHRRRRAASTVVATTASTSTVRTPARDTSGTCVSPAMREPSRRPRVGTSAGMAATRRA